MRFLQYILIAFLLIVCFLIAAIIYKQTTPPKNIVFISIDTIDADAMSVYGYHKNTTPRIKEFAKSATVYKNVYTVFPETFPSFYILFTGNDIFNKTRVAMAEESKKIEKTLPNILQENGYYTAAFVTNPVIGRIFPFFKKGYDDFTYINESPDETDDASYVYDYQSSVQVTEKSKTWLEENKTKPFFLWVHYTTPHMPYNPAKKYLCQIDKECNSEKYNELLHENSPESSILKSCGFGKTPDETIKVAKNLYDAEILSVDEEVGKLLDALQHQGLDKNTIVILYGDHGEGFDHDIFGHQDSLYDSGIHIPLIIKNPGTTMPKEVTSPISNLDILPSLLSLLGIKHSEKYSGNNFITNEKQNDFIYAFTPQEEGNKYVIMDGRYKYIYSNSNACLYNGLKEELYDYKNDPNEKNNLVEKKKEIFWKYQDLLFRRLGETEQGNNPSIDNNETMEKLKSLGY